MSQSTFKILFYLRKNRLNKNGQATIMVRITLSGDISQFSSKLEIEPHLWDTKAGKAAGKSSSAAKMNALLENVKNSLTNHYRQIDERDSSVTVEKIRNAFLGFETRQQTLLELFSKHNEEAAKLVGISKTKATLQKYTCTYNHIERFMKLHYHISDIALKDIKHMFITDWETYLRTEGGCSENTTAKFMQFFKRIILIARNNGWIIGDPFANYKIRLKRVDRGYLNEQEIAAIVNKKFTAKRLEQVRDVFIFSCHTGLAYIDVKNLTEKNIITSFDGKLWIATKRQKTDTPVNVPLLNIPLAILDKYKGVLPRNALLPVLSNQKMNSYLKEIGDVCGMEKNLTFHVARHNKIYYLLKNRLLQVSVCR